MSQLKARLIAEITTAMKARSKERLAVLRLMSAEIKRFEVDTRKTLDDKTVIMIFAKMVKQRNDSIAAFTQAKRYDLVAIEQTELDIIQTFLPQALSDAEINAHILATIEKLNASSIKEMGAVMAILRPICDGRADMKHVSNLVRQQLL